MSEFRKEPLVQLDIFAAEKEKQEGIERAAKNANRKHGDWIDKAYAFLISWLYKQPSKHKFMLEEVRAAATGFVPEPPDNRAWGAVSQKAKKDKLIKCVGWGQTSSKKSHRCPSAIWQKL